MNPNQRQPRMVNDQVLRPPARNDSGNKKKIHRLKFFKSEKFRIVLGALLLFALLILTFMYISARREVRELSGGATSAGDTENQIIDQVDRMVILPEGETPTIVTISDVSKLSGQAFFDRAQNGDVVLIYPNAKEAILYRPFSQKVVQIAPVNLGDEVDGTE